MDDRQLTNQLQRLFQVKDFDVDALLARAEQEDRIQRRRACGAAIAAGFALLTPSSMYFSSSHPGAETYSTTTEQALVGLQDDSVAALDAETILRAEYSAHVRDLRLDKGHALFKVRHDPQRPFRVHVSSRIIKAVGTTFDVRITGGESTVSVVEGLVDVEDAAGALQPIALAEGQSATIMRDGRVGEVRAVDITAVIAWRQSHEQWEFTEQPLTEIIREFNRHNAAPKFLIEGMGVDGIHRSAGFTSSDPQELLKYLREKPELELIQRGQDVVVRRRNDTRQSEMR